MTEGADVTGNRLATKLMIAALVVVPVSGATVFIAVFARDTAEVASALAAGAGALFLASFFQIGLFFRDVRAIAAREAESRGHALTLARCLKDISRRIAALETAQVQPTPTETLPALPAAGRRHSEQAVAHALAECGPAPSPVVPVAPSERRFVTLPQRRLAGIELLMVAAGEAADDFARGFGVLAADSGLCEVIETAALMVETGTRPASALILVAAPANLTRLPAAMNRLAELAEGSELFRMRFRLGISHDSVRSGGMAQAAVLARLARAGISYMLTDAHRDGLDAEALRACNITHLRIDAPALLAGGDAVDRFRQRCGEAGLTIVADGVDDPRMIAELIELGIPLAGGAAFTRDGKSKASIVAMPHRPDDSMAEPPELVVHAHDSVRYRAAG